MFKNLIGGEWSMFREVVDMSSLVLNSGRSPSAGAARPIHSTSPAAGGGKDTCIRGVA